MRYYFFRKSTGCHYSCFFSESFFHTINNAIHCRCTTVDHAALHTVYRIFPDDLFRCFQTDPAQLRCICSQRIHGHLYSYLGGAHPNTVYFAWNYDLDSGMFLTISELAADPQTFTLAVADMIEVQAEEQIASTPELEGQSLSDVYWDNYRETLEKWSSDYAASFDADGLTVIFSAYELASYANGPQEFHFPYAALDSYWSDSGRAVLGLN